MCTISSIFNEINEPNFEKLEKSSNYRVGPSIPCIIQKKKGCIPVYSNQPHIFPKDAAK